MNKLTPAQLALLKELAEAGPQNINATYRPAIRLKELGLAETAPGNVRTYTPRTQITDAGRAALATSNNGAGG